MEEILIFILKYLLVPGTCLGLIGYIWKTQISDFKIEMKDMKKRIEKLEAIIGDEIKIAIARLETKMDSVLDTLKDMKK